jgi:diguanylate cyclase (GGDEF)-like protein
MRLPSLQPSLLARFALLSLVPTIVLGLVLARDLRHSIRAEAITDARTMAKLTARLRIQPLLRPSDLRGPLHRERSERLTATLRSELGRDDVARIKLWNRRGQVVYSDDPSIIGRAFGASDELDEALDGEVVSEVTHLHRAEQARDRRNGELVEVYVPLRFSPGAPPAGAFEIYVPYRAVAARIEGKTRHTFVLLLGGLGLLWATLFRIVGGASKRLRMQAADNRHQALHDSLTGLPNRTLFRDRAAQALLAARREGAAVGVLLMDLDRFKDVNDSLGHHTGDELLRQVGERVRARLRASDTVARLGGDEFAVLLPGVTDAAAAAAVGRELRAALEPPFTLSDAQLLHADASVGVALFPDHGADADALIQRADVAMYQAKRDRAGVAEYDADSDQSSPERLALLAELSRAIDRDELVLHYQPKVNLTGGIDGAEALLRWQHPERGLIPPAEFIPFAEQTGLMRPLTAWVLEAALRQASDWRRDGLDIALAVNLSAANLADPALPDDIEQLLHRMDVPPDRLTLEITESTAMADPARARTLLVRLRELGVGLSIDDFGTGHSSLAYLSALPVTELKIDRSFVMSIATDDGDAAIVRSTIDLGHNLGLRVVAEGVEDDATLHWLRDHGCDLAQGYGLSRPLPAADVAAWLDRWGATVERAGVCPPTAASAA